MKCSEIEEDFPRFKKITSQYFDNIYERSYANHLRYSERVSTFLFTTNAGGAIAALSFIGSSRISVPSSWATRALCSYVLGVIMVGILMIVAYYKSLKALSNWSGEIEKFYRDEVGWYTLISCEGAKSSKFKDVTCILSFFSFLFFICGSICGGFVLMNVKKEITSQDITKQTKQVEKRMEKEQTKKETAAFLKANK